MVRFVVVLTWRFDHVIFRRLDLQRDLIFRFDTHAALVTPFLVSKVDELIFIRERYVFLYAASIIIAKSTIFPFV